MSIQKHKEEAGGGSEEPDNEDFSNNSGAESEVDDVGDANKKGEAICEVKKMDSKAAKKVWVWKSVLIFLIVTTATLVSGGTYVFLQRKEDEDYQGGYMQMVHTIEDTSEFHSTQIFSSLQGFSQTITAAAIGQNETFPFVTIPSFEAIASGVRTATGAEMINWHVMVNKSQLEDWRTYTSANVQSHQDAQRVTALALNTSSVQESDFVEGEMSPYPYIPQFEGDKIKPGPPVLAPDYGEGPYFPAWMVSPPPFSLAFFNSDPYPWALKSQIGAVLARRAVVFTGVTPIGNLAGRAIIPEDHENYHKTLVDYNTDDPDRSAFDHPHPAAMVPIFEKINDPTSRLVGTFAVIFPWDRFLTNLLPEGVDGITCVLRSSCGQAYTYLLDGNRAFYVGEGDFHDPAYDDTEQVLPFGDYFADESYETVSGECTWEYYVYATEAFEDQYRSNLPWALTLVVATTFLAMILTFVIYDVFVTHRNKQAVGVATKTNAIVTDLFPKQVRERLMDEAEQKQKRSKVADRLLENFLNGGEALEGAPESSPPIADLYDECTVYFADIVGFTKWSSSRQPVEVFTLLEALYKEFDAIANRRSVFKIETIGDCYVAITGLPQPRKNHAQVMCRFANDTRDSMRMVTKRLEPTLGVDTSDLDLRIGLHSGAVTAGVLRGEKSRFQLFGDTVNVAARMESSCQKGKIHVSEATAMRLKQGGKESWLTIRNEKVEAKGKGIMQTYWVEVSGTAQTATSHCFSSFDGDDGDQSGRTSPTTP